ncbi:DUF1786 domain-containing protein [Desulfonauticus submarinus]
MNILCLDIGSGTQDVLYFQEGVEIENCPKFILPSPAMQIATQIRNLTAKQKDIFLYGKNMGGGYKFALFEHLKAGFKVFVAKDAYFSLADDLEKVKKMGIEIVENPPKGAAPIYLTDFSPSFWQTFLNVLNLDYPDIILACAQDHGFFPHKSNRKGRFELWKKFISQNNNIYSLLYDFPPIELNRLFSLRQSIGQGLVADTGVCAILGAMFDSKIEELQEQQGICIVNIGNSHVLGFLVYKSEVYGVYEHHTRLRTGEQIWEDIQLFKKGKLKNEDVFSSNGHGCVLIDLPVDFGPIFVLGPRRAKLSQFDVEFLCPGGDMMLAGCFGLLKGFQHINRE